MRNPVPRFISSAIVAIGFAMMASAQPPRPPEGKSSLPPAKIDPSLGGVQWFATWDAAKAEAKRTNKPILMVSAAPHCSGISGIW